MSLQERIDLAQKASSRRRANVRPRSAEPLARSGGGGGGQTSNQRAAAVTAMSSAGAKHSEQQPANRTGKDDIDVPRPSAKGRSEIATKEGAGNNAASSATGVDNGAAGPQELTPVVGRLKTPAFHGVKIRRGVASGKSTCSIVFTRALT